MCLAGLILRPFYLPNSIPYKLSPVCRIEPGEIVDHYYPGNNPEQEKLLRPSVQYVAIVPILSNLFHTGNELPCPSILDHQGSINPITLQCLLDANGVGERMTPIIGVKVFELRVLLKYYLSAIYL